MRDWRALVRERLRGRALTDDQQNEVVTELAAHLEDLYDEQRTLGASESQAIHLALDEVSDWRQLERKIRRSKHQEGYMNDRTRTLWLPGLVSLTAAMGMLMLMNRLGIKPTILWYRSRFALEFYLPWLLCLPLFGGLGAYLSRRSLGQFKMRLAAALFPAIAIFGLFCFGITTSLMVERRMVWHAFPGAFALMVFTWVLLPGAALALGALPFLRNPQGRKVEPKNC